MWWMMRRKSEPRNERGAVAVIVAILFPVVILGLGAIVLDVGSGYAQRAQLQNGADAGALAVARSCAAGACDATTATTFAASNTNNSLDTTSQVTTGFPCGRTPSGVSSPLPTCPDAAEHGVCPRKPTAANYVDVLDNPLQSDGTKLVPDFFGKALRGPDYKGQAVGACAQVQWGPAGFDGGVALTISYCDWNNYTDGGTNFAPAPPYPPYPSAPYAETVLQFKQVTDTSCPHGPAGGTPIPSGFGRLDPNSSDLCTATYSATGEYDAAPGNGNADGWLNECPDLIYQSWFHQTVLKLPIFDEADAGGTNGEYHLNNLAAFVITAYVVQNGNHKVEYSSVPNSPYAAANYSPSHKLCDGNTCLIGYFVTATDPDAPIGGGSLNGGVTVPPKLAG